MDVWLEKETLEFFMFRNNGTFSPFFLRLLGAVVLASTLVNLQGVGLRFCPLLLIPEYFQIPSTTKKTKLF